MGGLLAQRFDGAFEPVLGIDLEGRLSYLSPSFSTLIGIPREALIGTLPPYPFIAPETQDSAIDIHWRAVDGRATAAGIEVVRLQIRSSKGETFPVLVTGGPIHQGRSAVGLIVFVHDLREADCDLGLAGERLMRRTRLYREYSRSERALDSSEAGTRHEHARHCPVCRAIGPGRVSVREHEVLVAFVESAESSVIAEQLGISKHTLRNHFKSIFRRLGVRSRLELYRLLVSWPLRAIVILAQPADLT
ncbi:MAG: LuxR C-terminal-related transcriptional regulator [Myxococcota bacterium]